MTLVTSDQTVPYKKTARFNRWDSPWLNPRLIAGFLMILAVVLLAYIGPLFWDVTQARVASAPLNMPPIWVKGDLGPGFHPPDPAHPLGTESNGRDMLALLMAAAPASLRVGLIAAGVGMALGILLGFTAGFVGGWVDNVIRIIADAFITIPALAVLIVISAFVRQINVENMALLLALFAWPYPTRLIRAQVLSMRERGYVQMARLSGASTFAIMFK